jgi:FkbM family methyltransferase
MQPVEQHDPAEAFEKAEIRAFFGHRRNGVCVEVGSNDPISPRSQSLHLEQDLGWRCLLIEPNPILARAAREHRPTSTVREAACTDPGSVGTLSLNIPINEQGDEVHEHAGLERNADEHDYARFRAVEVPALTLTRILDDAGIQQVDFVSIDVEGSELEVLQGFDLARFRPRLILLEDKHLYLKKHRLLRRHGYRLVRRLNRNCWYIPEGVEPPKVAFPDKLKLLKRLYFSIWFKKLGYAWHHRTVKPFTTL